MLYTDFICNVVCMANQTIYGLFLHILVNQHIEGVQPNNPVCISDFQKLAVCQISDYICQRSCIGMGCHQGAAAHLCHVPEGTFICMGNIYQHVLIMQLSDSLFAQLGQPSVGVALRPCRQIVLFVPGKHCMTAAEIIQLVNLIQIRTDAGKPFQSGQNIKLACFSCFFDFLQVLYNNRFFTLSHFVLNAVHQLSQSLCRICIIGRINPQNKAAAFDVALS